MKVLVFGAGYLGTNLADSNNYSTYGIELIQLSKEKIQSIADVERELSAYKPDVVINTIAKTGRPNVDWCESNKTETLFSNTTVPLMILDACKRANVQMVHIGTGCLYRTAYKLNESGAETGNIQQFSENDEANFLPGYYSKTKYYADCLLAENGVLILRPRQMFDGSHNDRNLVCKLIKYDKLINSQNSMVYIPDLIDAMFKLIFSNQTGIFNVVNSGAITPYQIICLYQEIVDSSHKFGMFKSISELDGITKSPRTDCLLDITKLEQTIDQSMPNVEDRVITSLNQFKSTGGNAADS